ncbi:MAG: hypothetical protein AVDCRST_MAG13-1630, partial [uncultured Solirubrobacteraceae bacterium]
RGGRRGPRLPALGARGRRPRGRLRPHGRPPPPARGPPRGGATAGRPPAHRRRPAHAHGPLRGLRHPGRGAPGHGPRPGPRGDRGDRPQRDLRGARGAGQGLRVRREGHRVRGGQDRLPGRGHRALPHGEDPARALPAGDHRGDPPPGRPRLRPAPVRPHALRAGLRAPAGHRGRHRRDRGLQPARGHRLLQRGGRPLRRQVPDRGGRGLGLPRGAGPGLRARADAGLRRAGGVPGGAARRGDPHEAVEPALRAGAEVPRDEGHPVRGAPGAPGAAGAAGDPQGL